jgi:hypothetical protein
MAVSAISGPAGVSCASLRDAGSEGASVMDRLESVRVGIEPRSERFGVDHHSAISFDAIGAAVAILYQVFEPDQRLGN